MPRLDRGANEKIDRINDYVAVVQDSSKDGTMEQEECLKALLKLFLPLSLKICKKWSNYFNDTDHKLIQFSELMGENDYWFMYYTKYKYTCGGSATFNTFIKNHMDQRIRYIYEQRIKYYRGLIFPDPDKRSDEDIDAFDSVIYNYKSNNEYDDVENKFVDNEYDENRVELANKILNIVRTNGVFNDREREIFISITYNGITHDEMGKRLNISRTRITQILRKTKAKLYKIMNESQDVWDLVIKADVDFNEM